LLGVKATLPRWIERVKYPNGFGRYRFAVDAYEPYDLDSSCMMHNIRGVTEGALPEPERLGWIEYLQSLQRHEDGLLIDAGMEKHIIAQGATPTADEVFAVRRWTSRNGLTILHELGGRPKYRLAHQECFRSAAEVERHLEGLNWKNPWSGGSQAGTVIWSHVINKLMGDPDADAVIRAAVAWLVRRQDPATGAWSDGSSGIPLHQLVNGIFKVWIQAIPSAGLPVQYPEQVVDLCIRAIREDPTVSATEDACSIFDVALVLDTALRFSDHRRDEVAELAAACLPAFASVVRDDGAFSYHPHGSLLSHGGLSLGPATMQSDAPGTAINCSAIGLLANLCGLRDELGWTPTTEARMGLPTKNQ
jgi:hypothetical protein